MAVIVNGREVLDPQGMFARADGLAGQARDAVAAARGVEDLPSSSGIQSVLVLGMGGSGISGDVLRAVAAGRAQVPIETCKSYELPAYVDADTLVFAVSYSGNTEETLEAARTAVDRGARVVAVTSGGVLGTEAEDGGIPVVDVVPGAQPRAMIAALSMPLIVVCERLGLLPGADEDVSEALTCLEARIGKLRADTAEDGNLALRIARRLDRRIALVYGGPGPAAVAAYRWKCQLNENAKTAAFWNNYSALDHNEICGWGQHGDITRQLVALVQLRHDGEHPQIARRFDVTAELVEEAVSDVIEVRSRAHTPLGRFFDLAVVGDYVSLYLAALAEVDPGPVEVIERLKAELAS